MFQKPNIVRGYPLELKIITYNLHKGFSIGSRRFVLHEIRDQLRQTSVDLVFLQEIYGEHQVHQERINTWPSETHIEFLADSIWSHYAYGKNAIYQAGHHGNAILSKFPITESRNINLSSFRRASRSLLHGVIDYPSASRNLHVICIHMELVRFEQKRQLQTIKTHLNENIPADDPLILAGDFNDWDGHIDRFIQKELGLKEAFHHQHGVHARTFPSVWPLLKMDRIYFRGMTLRESACFTGTPWNRLSDHTPLYAQLELE